MEELRRYAVDMMILMVAFVSPIAGVVAAMFTFVLADLITGIMKAKKKGGRKEVKSRKMSNSVAKFIFYFIGILSAHMMNHFLELEMPLVKMMLGFVIAIELKSIDENMYEVLGYSIFGKLLDIVKRKEAK